MRLERTGEGFGARAELKVGRNGIQILTPQQIARLAVWIEELFPEEVTEARKPRADSGLRTDEGVPDA